MRARIVQNWDQQGDTGLLPNPTTKQCFFSFLMRMRNTILILALLSCAYCFRTPMERMQLSNVIITSSGGQHRSWTVPIQSEIGSSQLTWWQVCTGMTSVTTGHSNRGIGYDVSWLFSWCHRSSMITLPLPIHQSYCTYVAKESAVASGRTGCHQ